MGLFAKKYCDICGEKIGLFGNRKLEDGNMCKNCAKKLSPWFSDRRHTDLAGIKEQLEYRENNKQDVAQFHPTLKLGEHTTVYVDEDAGTFMVTDADPKNWDEANPDVFQLDEVTECNLDIKENREELTYEDKDGNEVSYTPRRFEYRYTFKMQILLDHPFVDEIEYDLNYWPLKIEYRDRSLFGTGHFDPERDSEYRNYVSLADEIMDVLTAEEEDYEDEESEESGEVFEDENGKSFRVVTCPYCGAKSRMTYNGRCENCGGNLEG